MQTLVLTASTDGTASTTRESVDAGTSRVEARYGRLWRRPPTRQMVVSATAGMVLWEPAETPSRWPAWAAGDDGVVASVYAPLGHGAITGSTPLESAPITLVDELVRAQHRIERIAAPFVCARLGPTADTLDIFTDAVGVGRFFEVRTPTGWVWSNRPLAALVFAGMAAAADPEAWLQSAAADEFFGHSTPYEGVRAVEPATHVHWDGRGRRRRVTVLDTCASWVPAAGSSERSLDSILDAAAADLTDVAASIAGLYKEPLVVDLTGGRDSRLVAAAILASGTDVVLHTHDANPGDLEIARTLVSMAPHPVEHRVRHVASGGEVEPRPVKAVDHARRWHDFAEGLRPCTYLYSSVPAHLDGNRQVIVGGVGGEAAHGFLYPGDFDAFAHLPLEEQLRAHAARIVKRKARVPGPSREALAQVNHRVLAQLERVASWGVRGLNILDHYYVLQVMRRWGTAGERLGIVSPLLAPSFLTAALALTPQERRSNTLHRELTRRLIPAWADVPYFPGEVVARGGYSPARFARVIRLADAEDRQEVERILTDVDDWGDAFDTAKVHRLWHLSLQGVTTSYQEHVLRSVMWRAAFTDHLTGVHGGVARTRPVADIPVPPPIPSRRVRRFRAHPVTRAAAGTRAWQRARATPVGRALRSVLQPRP